jgi:hypothetical protein
MKILFHSGTFHVSEFLYFFFFLANSRFTFMTDPSAMGSYLKEIIINIFFSIFSSVKKVHYADWEDGSACVRLMITHACISYSSSFICKFTSLATKVMNYFKISKNCGNFFCTTYYISNESSRSGRGTHWSKNSR